MIYWIEEKYTTKETEWVVLRAEIGQANLVVYVSSKGGWNNGNFEKYLNDNRFGLDTKKYNVRLSTNGVLMMTFDQMAEIVEKITEVGVKLHEK